MNFGDSPRAFDLFLAVVDGLRCPSTTARIPMAWKGQGFDSPQLHTPDLQRGAAPTALCAGPCTTRELGATRLRLESNRALGRRPEYPRLSRAGRGAHWRRASPWTTLNRS